VDDRFEASSLAIGCCHLGFLQPANGSGERVAHLLAQSNAEQDIFGNQNSSLTNTDNIQKQVDSYLNV